MREKLREWAPAVLACAALVPAYKLYMWILVELGKVVYPWMF